MPARKITDSSLVFPKGKVPGWTHAPEGLAGGKFGRVLHVAVCDEEGNFLFDKPVMEEGPHVITITYGVDNGTVKMALIKEQRDTAAKRLDGTDSPVFWGPPRGYAELTDEGIIAAGRREAGEEAGADVLLGEPWIITVDTIPNETIVRSRSPWVAIPVDLKRLSAARHDRHEKIFKAEFFSAEEIAQMIVAGEHDGASTNSWCLMAAYTLFTLRVLPEVKAAALVA